MSAVLDPLLSTVSLHLPVPERPTRSQRLAAQGVRFGKGDSRARRLALTVLSALLGLAVLVLA